MNTSYSIRSPRQNATARFLTSRADDLECEANDLMARATVLSRYGLAEPAVSLNVRASDLLDRADLLRAQAQRVSDMAQDEREMRAEGFTQAEIARYIARTYGKAAK